MKTVNVTIQGITPLLCNKFTDYNLDPPGPNTGDRPTPKEQAAAKLYIGSNKKPMIPQPNVFRCIIAGGKFFKIGASKVTTLRNSMIPSCIEVDGVEFPIKTKEGWDVDTRPVRIPKTGGRIICHRPSFNDWEISFSLIVDTDLISLKLVREILDSAGKRVGLGDYRPDCKGPYGKFVVTSWKEV